MTCSRRTHSSSVATTSAPVALAVARAIEDEGPATEEELKALREARADYREFIPWSVVTAGVAERSRRDGGARASLLGGGAYRYAGRMAEPTLQDVLTAIAEVRSQMATKESLATLDSKVATLDSKVATLDSKVATLDSKVDALDSKVDALDSKVDAHRAETARSFAELDRDLAKHMDVHREIEKDITSLKARPARTAARPTRTRTR